MRIHALLLLSVGLLIGADAQDDDAKKELKKLSGTYVMVSGETKAEKLPEERIKEAEMIIEGEKYTATFGGDTVMGTFKVDPTKTPKEIEATDSEGKTILGIYKFDKDQFTVCFASPDKDRPNAFSIKAGTGDFIHVWKKKRRRNDDKKARCGIGSVPAGALVRFLVGTFSCSQEPINSFT